MSNVFTVQAADAPPQLDVYPACNPLADRRVSNLGVGSLLREETQVGWGRQLLVSRVWIQAQFGDALRFRVMGMLAFGANDGAPPVD